MKRPFHLTCCTIAFFLLAPLTHGQELRNQPGAMATCPTEVVKPGVVIEELGKNSEAQQAGMIEGDILLHWTRGDVKGDINTPFDIWEIETEQSPRGQVVIEGIHDGERKRWKLGEGLRGGSNQAWELWPNPEFYWMAKTRPNLRDSLLAIYDQGQQLAKAGKVKDTADLWRAGVRDQTFECPLLNTWFSVQAAKMLGTAKLWSLSNTAYEEAIQSAKESGPRILSKIYQSRAKAFEQQRDWTNAEKYYRQAISERQKLSSDDLSEADNLRCLGTMYRGRSEFEKAEQSDRRALTIQEALAPNTLLTAGTINHLGLIAANRSEAATAAKYYRQAIVLLHRIAPDSRDLANSLNNLAMVACNHGDFVTAERSGFEARSILRKVAPSSLELAATIVSLGTIASRRGELDKAEKYYEEALVIEERLAPDSLDVATSVFNLGFVAYARGDLTNA